MTALLSRSAMACEWCHGKDRCTKTRLCSLMAGYVEAQIKERTTYVSTATRFLLCTEGAHQRCSTPLNDRIVMLVNEAAHKAPGVQLNPEDSLQHQVVGLL